MLHGSKKEEKQQFTLIYPNSEQPQSGENFSFWMAFTELFLEERSLLKPSL